MVVIAPFVPELSRWLVVHGRNEAALKVLFIVQGKNKLDMTEGENELETSRTTVEREANEYPETPWKEIASTPANRKRLAILCTFGPMINFVGNFIIS